MPLDSRYLSVKITVPSSNYSSQLSYMFQAEDIHVRINKDALAVQHSANITIVNLSQSLRQTLLTQFTAFNRRAFNENTQARATANLNFYCNVEVTAGYINTKTGSNDSVVVFEGQVVEVVPSGAPPNQAFTLQCFTRQLDKSKFKSIYAPPKGTFKTYAQYVADQMGLQLHCNTSYDGQLTYNPFGTAMNVDDLLWDLQNMYRPDVMAFTDNGALIVMDRAGAIAARNVTNGGLPVRVSEFLGMPVWTPWGARYRAMMDPRVVLAGSVIIDSLLNPSLSSSAFVVCSIEYELASRDVPFYMTVAGFPPG